MRNRAKFDWSKPFKLVPTKKEFDQLDTNDESLVISINTEEPKPPVQHKKEQIPVPKIETVKRIGEVKPFARITPNYIRLPAHLNLPLASRYELTEVDHTFVKTHQDRFVFKGKKVLTPEFLEKAIVEMELKAGKDMTLPRNKGWMMTFLEKEYKELMVMDSIEQFAEMVYNYWKNRRQELKFPLLRLLWKPNPEEYNHMLAFRPREREKRSLRRTNRVVEQEIIEELYQEFDLATKIVDRVQMRQDLKLKILTAQLSSFYTDCKAFVPMPDYLQQLKPEDRAKDKERMKGLHSSLEAYKTRKENFQNMSVQEMTSSEIDQKQSIVNFLSTVVAEAEQLGLSYEKIFMDNKRGISVPAPASVSVVTQPMDIERKMEEPKNPEQFVHFSVQKYQDMLIRTFEDDESPVHHIPPCKDYLQLKRRRVDSYYFGSDDEGETKDLKKNIAASFKKYQQLQHINRTISATSEN